MSRLRTRIVLGLSAVTVLALATATPAVADRGWHGKPPGDLPKVPVMVGSGGAVSSVDRDASQVGIEVLARGGNAADAAVATAAALGVTEPYSAGIGGGGFFVYYDARTKKVSTIDGRETAPMSFKANTFVDPATGTPYPFQTVVDSGLSVGTPGTPALWDKAARTFGTLRLSELLKPAEQLAAKGFVVDQTFRDQTATNETRFRKFPETAAVFLPGGQLPVVGSTFTNPDMARAYRELRTHGVDSIYEGGRLGQAIVAEAKNPTTAPGVTVLKGQLRLKDLAAYEAPIKAPITSRYRGYDVYGMGVPSSGGIAVAEILNLIEAYEAKTGTTLASLDDANYLHWFSEASATAFADRNRWVGDVSGVPVTQLTSQAYANTRACALFDPNQAQPRPIPFGDPYAPSTSCAASGGRQGQPLEGPSTTHLVTADKWGNVASYTLTIESTGGSGLTVPGYGFLLNNELTDFNFTPLSILPVGTDPNLPGPGKRPRSSMSPTILLKDGRPYLAVGSPGGATIITSVSQTILGYVDRGLSLVDAIAAPRLSSRNGTEQAEPLVLSTVGSALTAKGHVLSSTPEIGAVTAIHPLGGGAFEAAAETVRRGGGSAMVVRPSP
ncbi:MAG TPA: gamma-glutamyltransferase [Lapillicoccus sp.]|jgi:gamma-glutamyltranspeptidase/glutathione hydrolase|nr:gamma-glutamyltransferase [Lapillicoccus sp.]